MKMKKVMLTCISIIALFITTNSILRIVNIDLIQLVTNYSYTDKPDTTESIAFGKYTPVIKMESIAFISGQQELPDGQTYYDNIWTRAYRDELGIDITFRWVAETYEEYEHKMSIAIFSNDLPDFAWVPSKYYYQMIGKGMLADITDAYNNYASHDIKDIIESPIGRHMQYAYVGNKLMGLPESKWAEPDFIWLRTDWMKQLNITAPIDIEGLVDFIRKLKEAKPHTLGLPIDKNFSTLQSFFAAYGAYPLSNVWVKDNTTGQLINGAVAPQVKNALSELQEMYKEGLIDPEFALKEITDVYNEIVDEKYGIIYGPQWQPLWPLKDIRQNSQQADWKPILPVTVNRNIAKTGISDSNAFYVINKNYPHPEALIKMANLKVKHLESDEAKTYYHTDAESNIPIFKLSLINITYPYRNPDIAKRFYTALTDGFDASGIRQIDKPLYEQIMSYYRGNTHPNAWAYAKIFGPSGSNDLMGEIIERDWFQYSAYIGSADFLEIPQDKVLQQLKIRAFTKIIMGEESIDSFDDFVSQWYKLGGREITQKVNKNINNN